MKKTNPLTLVILTLVLILTLSVTALAADGAEGLGYGFNATGLPIVDDEITVRATATSTISGSSITSLKRQASGSSSNWWREAHGTRTYRWPSPAIHIRTCSCTT